MIDLFFDERFAAVRDAKAICTACPNIEPCAQLGMDNQELYGVWGGTTYFDRIAISDQLGLPEFPRRDLIDHGTSRGWAQHKTHGIPIEEGDVCGCLEAYRADARHRMALYRERKKRRGR
jgi:hypothetical protein